MRVLICPDKFAGTLSAPEAADAIAAGWHDSAPDADVDRRPLADGGPGFLDVLDASLSGTRVPVRTVDPLGRSVDGWLLVVGDTAYVESAQACGLHLVTAEERDPNRTTSYGLGLLLAAAAEAGARTAVVGLGGSATNDAGAGMLAALGAAPVDDAGRVLPYGGAALTHVAGLSGVPVLRQMALVAATDVDNPLTGLHGASSVFGPQKGADRADVLLLDDALTRYARVLVRDVPGCPPDVAELPGAGAAGGLGAALYALGGRRESGAGLVRTAVGLDAALDECDLVVTGEGSFDFQSLRGKLPAVVAAAAAERGVPCLVLAGRVDVGRRESAAAGIEAAYSVVEQVGGVEAAMAQPYAGLRALAARVAGQWA
ncbi:glycerate kinase family protein [Actinocatenispora rupis]|uniref:Glycerate kinase n=1 Tax=Actinocatenispora rupis TaxID=519421 RepID=A0A8J3J7J9_9ACTN|nr:glycerate kinase [Actinocatenispora rupis]GID13457.1 glycerate kinase [Actinocatenispora rupis]